jgi:hypothetical protein
MQCSLYDQGETLQRMKEYVKYLEPAMPPTPLTSASLSSPITRSIIRSSPHHMRDKMHSPPALLNPVPAEIDGHYNKSPLSI